MADDLNAVTIIGRLTRDPELRQTGGGTSVVSLRIASNSRTKADGIWGDKANFFDVTAFGAQGENIARYCGKGKQIAVRGRLDWREWEAKDGTKRQAVQIIADSVQFLGSKDDAQPQQQTAVPATDVPVEEAVVPTAQAIRDGGLDDVPF